MGFKKLKEEFERMEIDHEYSNYEPGGAPAVSRENTFRYLALLCMYEIAGNLDSMVIAQRELLKLQQEWFEWVKTSYPGNPWMKAETGFPRGRGRVSPDKA